MVEGRINNHSESETHAVPPHPSVGNGSVGIFGNVGETVQSAFDALPSQAAILAGDGQVIYVNEAWRQFALQNGYAGPDLGVGRNYLDMSNATILDESGNPFHVQSALKKVLEGMSSGFYGEYTADSPRERRFFSVYAAPYVSPDGIGAIVVHNNITSRKFAMAELETEREVLQDIAGGAPLESMLARIGDGFESLLYGCRCAVAAVDPDLANLHFVTGAPDAAGFIERLFDLNPAARRILAEETFGLSDVADLGTLAEAIAGDNPMVATEFSGATGMMLAIHAADRRPVGLIVLLGRAMFNLSAAEGGLLSRLSGLARIAIQSIEAQLALRRSEERYALAFQGANDGLWDWDTRSHHVFCSDRCLEILGFGAESKPASNTVTHDWWLQRIHPDDLAHTVAAFDTCLNGGRQSFAAEYRMRRADDSYCWLSDRGAIIRNADGESYRAAGSITDISNRKLVEQQRRELEEQLRDHQKTEALGTLAGGIAHDINNTLMPVFGSVDLLLLDADPDSDTADTLRDIQSSALKVKDLVRQILAFSRKESVERETFDLVDEIGETLRMLRAMVPTTISLEVESDLDSFAINANRTQLHQVAMNLINNAVAAIGPNQGRIWIRLATHEVETARLEAGREIVPGLYCRISVIDSGPGIPPEVKSRLFDPFFTTKAVGEGTGLGLSVVKGIVIEHRGFIEVSNEPNAGARLDVHFPKA